MNTSNIKLGLSAIAFAFAFGTAMPVNAAEPAQGQTDAMTFARGAKTWGENCGRCHNLRDPKEFRDDQWKIIVSHMRIRAGLTGKEARDVLKFLQGSN